MLSLSELFESVTSSSFWLPKNINWNDFDANTDMRFPDRWMLVNKLIPVIVIVFTVRHVLVRYVFCNWGIRMNIRSVRTKKAPFSKQLEDIYIKAGSKAMRDAGQLKRMSETTGLSPEQVYKWFKIRRLQDEISDLDKFTEDCWMTAYCTALCVVGCFALYGDPVLLDINVYWDNYPFQSVEKGHELFFISGMALFVVDIVVLVTKKHETSDLNLRLYHHVAGFSTLALCWLSNEVRVGAVVLFMLETCSPFIYTAKMAEWLNWPKTSVVLFAIAFAHWCLIRTLWFHLIALPGIFLYRHVQVGFVPAHVLNDFFVAQLLIANLCWVKMVYSKVSKALFKGEYFKIRLDDNSFNELSAALRKIPENGVCSD